MDNANDESKLELPSIGSSVLLDVSENSALHFLNLMIDMTNIFDVFLPQLLHYPNPTDPLNGEAAALLMREPAA